MLRKRLIAVLTFNDGVLFRTKLFEPDYRYTHNFVDAWSVDEIVMLDITRPGGGERASFDGVVTTFTERCFVPLTVGGGVRSLDDARRYLALGADKVVLNTGALERPALITEIAESYGAQCVVLSIDARRADDGYEVYGRFASEPTGLTPVAWAREGERLGAGEILITSVERDGSLEGYEIGLCRAVCKSVAIPVLIGGGAGNWKHFVAGFTECGASAVCTSNIYHFTDTSIRSAKAHVARAGVPMRLS